MNLDVWADHALVCSCKGDRTIRHNAIRDSAFRFAKAAGLNPVREKPGLLPPRPDQESIQEPRHANGRRPADIWLPRFWDGGAVALDFGVTSGLRVGELHTSALDCSRVTADYENFKRSHLSTADECEQRGLLFAPMIVEAHGGSWGLTARDVWKSICKAYADQNGCSQSFACSELAQRLSTTLERENARAILRRLTPVAETNGGYNAAAWTVDFDPPDDPSGDVEMVFQ